MLNVSRETMDKLNIYYDLLKEWNPVSNLVQIKTLENFWERHVVDSLQLVSILPHNNCNIIDLGSGAGFPGLIIAMVNYPNMTLVEANFKKAIFLEEVIRKTNLKVKVIQNRIESLSNLNADIIVSRALAPLVTLLGYMQIVSRETNPIGIFPKGEKYQEEIEEAQKKWVFNYELIDSQTDKQAKIIKINNLVGKR